MSSEEIRIYCDQSGCKGEEGFIIEINSESPLVFNAKCPYGEHLIPVNLDDDSSPSEPIFQL